MRIEWCPGGERSNDIRPQWNWEVWREKAHKRSADAGAKSGQVGHFGQRAQQCRGMQITVKL